MADITSVIELATLSGNRHTRDVRVGARMIRGVSPESWKWDMHDGEPDDLPEGVYDLHIPRRGLTFKVKYEGGFWTGV
jgi:hypothetical protein